MIKDNTLKIINKVLALCGLLAIFYILIMTGNKEDTVYSFDDSRIEEWNDGWDINYAGNVIENVSLPVELPVESGNMVMLRKTLPDKIKEYNCIMLEGNRQDIEVSIGGIQRAEHSNKENRVWGKTSPSGVVLVPLYNTDSRVDVTIHITSDSEYSGQIGNIYIGNEKSLIILLLKNSFLCTIFTMFVFIVGIVCYVIFLTYVSDYEITKALHYLAVFSVLSSVFSFSQLSIGQIFGSNLTVIEAIGYLCFIIIPVPLALYVDCITEGVYKKIITAYVYFGAAAVLLQLCLFVFKHIGFFEMRYISWFNLIAGVLGTVVIYTFEMQRQMGKMVKILFASSICLLMGVLGELFKDGFGRLYDGFDSYIVAAFIFVGIGFINITLHVGFEQRKRKEAESANKAKSMFLATMSHEIKTPINAILGMNEMILRDSKDDNICEYANNINSAGNHLVALVNDVLDFSKIESGKMDIISVDYNIKSILNDMILMTETRLNKKNIKLILEIDESMPKILNGDSIRIKQVVMNLLTNAAKYTEQGSITFTVKTLNKTSGNISLYFGVKDTGLGIKNEDIEKFMESFVRVDQVRNSSVEGTGLGLAITSQLLELMDSKLNVESTYGEGSNFSFTIVQKIVDDTPIGPLKDKTQISSSKKEFTFTAPEISVLAVDDTKINLKVISGILKPTQMKVDVCDSGAKCLELCQNNHYDIIFMDHMMPEMDGVETLSRLKNDKKSLSNDARVFVLTANTVAGAAEMYRECGFDYYFKKPIDIKELDVTLQKFIPKEKIIPIESMQVG